MLRALGQVLFTVLLAGLGAGLAAQTAPINIMAGPEGSTSHRAGLEIQALTDGCGLSVNVHSSAGALDNLQAVKARKYTQFGIIQNDVLEYLTTYEPDVPDIAYAMRGIKVAFPMFPQEVHLLVRGDINSVEELDGKRISIGSRDSGTFLTATVLMDLLTLDPAERLEFEPHEAIEALLRNEIDAMFFVDGAPSDVFGHPGLTAPAEGVVGARLLPLNAPILEAVYDVGQIPAGTYAFASDPTPTITVRAVMIAYDYVPKGRNRYNTANCNMVSTISRLVIGELDALKAGGHPKWNEVDPAAEIMGFDLSKCAKRGLTQEFPVSCK